MITLKNIKKTFPGSFSPVLNEVNLQLKTGDFCVLIGANGSGKSTLLKLIHGDCLADAGRLQVEGKVAQVVQDVNIGTVPELTLLENIALSQIKKPTLQFYSRYKAQIIEKINALNIDLDKYIDYPLKALSGGQRQTIATLMAIHSGCPILLLDEHTSALDPKMQNFLMQYTANQISALGLTTLMITHKMDDAIKYGNRLIMLHQGKIVLDVQGKEKQALSAQNLLALFHQYEDQSLLSGERNEH